MAALPAAAASLGRATPARLPLPQPQRPPPPRQPKLAVAGPAELVTCDQTIERTISRLKGWRRVATRYEKRKVNYLAMVTIAAIVTLWLE